MVWGMLDFVFIVSLIWVSCWEACVLVVAGLMFGASCTLVVCVV